VPLQPFIKEVIRDATKRCCFKNFVTYQLLCDCIRILLYLWIKDFNHCSSFSSLIQLQSCALHPFPSFSILRRSLALGYGPNDRGFEWCRGWEFFSSPPCPDQLWGPPSLLSNGTRDSFSRGKPVGAWIWPLTSIWCRGQEFVGLYLHSPNTPSWRGAQLKGQALEQLYLYLTFTILSTWFWASNMDMCPVSLNCVCVCVCVCVWSLI
jgi:hypothetical protein